MPVRLNPPEPLSLAAHFADEQETLKNEHEALAALNLMAKGLGYNFEGRENTLSLLRTVDILARKWTNQSHNDVVQADVDEGFIRAAMRQVARDHNIPCAEGYAKGAQPVPSL